MSSFPAGSIASSLNFDTSSWTGGFAEVVSTATSFPGLVANNLDAPMAQAAAHIGASAHQAAEALHQGIETGVREAGAAMGTQLAPPMDEAAVAISSAAMQAGQSISREISEGVQNAESTIASGLAPPMASAAAAVSNSAHEAGEAIGNEIEHGMLSAEAAMKLFPALVIELIENPILGAVAVAKEALEGLFEVMEGVGDHFHKVGLEAEKIGMDPDVFYKYASAAKASGIEMESFGNALKFMEDRAANALRGDEGGAKAFADLGIGAKELTELLHDSDKMLLRVADAMKELDATMRPQAAMDMGRPIAEMIPFLSKGSEEIKRIANELKELSGGVNADQVKMGEKWGEMEAKFNAMWTRVKVELGTPILKYLEEHGEELIEKAKGWAQWLIDKIQEFGPKIIEFGNTAINVMGAIGDFASTYLSPIFSQLADDIARIFNAVKLLLDLISTGFHAAAFLGNSVIYGSDSPEANASYDAANAGGNRIYRDLHGGEDMPGYKVEVRQTINIDPHAVAGDVAKATLPAIHQARDQLMREYQGAKHADRIKGAFGGRR